MRKNEESKMYYVTEVGGFGQMEEFEDDDPTIQKIGKKKKRKNPDEMFDEAYETYKEINKRGK